MVPAVSCRAVPNGEVDYDFYQGIKNEILEVARKENEKKPLDAITLSLHGSMRIKKIGDANPTPSTPSLRERTNSVYSADRNFLRTSAITIP